MEPPPQPQRKNHWHSKEFDDLIKHAEDANDQAEYLQRLKPAYLLAKREAPPGTITAGEEYFKPVQSIILPDATGAKGSVIGHICTTSLEDLRIALKEHGLLDDEDSSE